MGEPRCGTCAPHTPCPLHIGLALLRQDARPCIEPYILVGEATDSCCCGSHLALGCLRSAAAACLNCCLPPAAAMPRAPRPAGAALLRSHGAQSDQRGPVRAPALGWAAAAAATAAAAAYPPNPKLGQGGPARAPRYGSAWAPPADHDADQRRAGATTRRPGPNRLRSAPGRAAWHGCNGGLRGHRPAAASATAAATSAPLTIISCVC
jgi:hypothetical protein